MNFNVLTLCLKVGEQECLSLTATAVEFTIGCARRASRDARVEPCCPTSATQHVTTFSSCAKMQGIDSVSCRDVPSGI